MCIITFKRVFPTKTLQFYNFSLGKTFIIDNYQMTNVLNMLDSLLKNINQTAKQTKRAVETYHFCWGARTFLTILEVNPQNSRPVNS